MSSPIDIASVDLNNPIVEDWRSFQDFRDALIDQAPEIENLIAQLKIDPQNRDTITNLFRAFHNIKGDAGLCRLFFIIPIIHSAEALLSRMRDGEIVCHAGLAEVFLLSLDRIEQAIDLLAKQQSLTPLALLSLANGLEHLAQQSAEHIEPATLRVIEAVTGFKPNASFSSLLSPSPLVRSEQEMHQDLVFFRELALQLEARSPLFQGRTERNLSYALATNKMAGNRVDPEQLEAAVYLHDIGMMFLPESQWLRPEQLSEEAKRDMQRHPAWAAEIAKRLIGWQDASQMILQHHETVIGSGYPMGLADEQICDGAKILAIIDAFEAVLLKHSHRGQQKSTLRAIAEINAGDRQFSAEWVKAFNRVIRQQLESPN